MATYDIDADVKRWGLHLLDVCTYANDGSQSIVTKFEYDPSFNQVDYGREGYLDSCNVENDEAIARAFQEELSKVRSLEASGRYRTGDEHVQDSVLVQDWLGPSKRHSHYEPEKIDKTSDEGGIKSKEGEDLIKIVNNEANEMEISRSRPDVEKASYSDEGCSYSMEIVDESALDGEVGKRLNHMVPIPHVPKTNEKLPSADEEISDHERLLERLQLYDLVELKVDGDGNCQFGALSDQLYRSPEYHDFVRQQIVGQLSTFREIYEGYVSMPYDDYLKKMKKYTAKFYSFFLIPAANGLFLSHATVLMNQERRVGGSRNLTSCSRLVWCEDIRDYFVQRYLLYRDSSPHRKVETR